MTRFTIALVAALALTPSVDAQRPVAPLPVAPLPLASAGAVRAAEAEVQSLPMLERPNRLGHFYGNTVRRRHYGTLVVNSMHSERPVARYFYVAR